MTPSSHVKRAALLGAMLLSAALPPSGAWAGTNSRLEAISLASMIEAQGNVMYALDQLGYLAPANALSWSGSYSEQGWSTLATTTLGGTPFEFSYSGLIGGSIGSTITVAFDGAGRIRNQVYNSSGVQTFTYDSAVGDYTELRTVEAGSIGAPDAFADTTVWQIAATEIAFAARKTQAGYEQDGVTGALTQGLSGLQIALMASNIALKIGAQGPVAPPPLPVVPPNPIPDPPPGGPTIHWFIGDGGNNTVDMLFQDVALNGRFFDGQYIGTISAVPEPVTWMTVVAGLAVLAWRMRGRPAATTS